MEKECGIKLRIGTPSGAMNNLLSRAMEAARRAGLDGAVTDASTHIYGGFAGAMELYRIGIEEVRKRMEPFPAGRGVPVHVTEFNGSAMGSRHFDTQTGAAFVVKANRLMADEGVLRTYFYCAIDHPYLNLEHHYSTDLGYMTHYDAVPKPSFNALVLLNRLEGKRLPVKASSEPFDAMAAVAGDGTTRIVVTTFSEEELGRRETGSGHARDRLGGEAGETRPGRTRPHRFRARQQLCGLRKGRQALLPGESRYRRIPRGREAGSGGASGIPFRERQAHYSARAGAEQCCGCDGEINMPFPAAPELHPAVSGRLPCMAEAAYSVFR